MGAFAGTKGIRGYLWRALGVRLRPDDWYTLSIWTSVDRLMDEAPSIPAIVAVSTPETSSWITGVGLCSLGEVDKGCTLGPLAIATTRPSCLH